LASRSPLIVRRRSKIDRVIEVSPSSRDREQIFRCSTHLTRLSCWLRRARPDYPLAQTPGQDDFST
jgi:hypothetical protein